MIHHTHEAVQIQGLRKDYGGVEAVRGIDLTVHQGETFALLGPNGAGKSTTVEILEGYRRRSDGAVSVLDEDPGTAGRSWRSRIGIVLQDASDAASLGPYTVREIVAERATYYPKARRVDEVIDAVGLSAKANARVATLSGGQRRRVDVAMGVIGRPELLFLDEPTTGFDPEARLEFWDLIAGLSRDGTTVLLTTHYLEEAAHLADRIGIVADGRLIECGALDEIGGPGRRVPTVTWREADGRVRSERTDAPGALVRALTDRLGEPTDLEVRRPSLEDVYLDLIRSAA